MSCYGHYLGVRIMQLKAREELLEQSCRDYEQDIGPLHGEIDRLRRREVEEGRSAPPRRSATRRSRSPSQVSRECSSPPKLAPDRCDQRPCKRAVNDAPIALYRGDDNLDRDAERLSKRPAGQETTGAADHASPRLCRSTAESVEKPPSGLAVLVVGLHPFYVR